MTTELLFLLTTAGLPSTYLLLKLSLLETVALPFADRNNLSNSFIDLSPSH